MARGPSVTLEIAEKRYGKGLPVLADIRLNIAPGSVVALVGPSGIGKSTLLRIIAGIDVAYQGRVIVDQIDARSAPPPGIMFQDARLLPWLTGLDNLVAVRQTIGVAEARRWLDRVGLRDAAGLFPAQMSGGMQRRLALARALSVNPRMLLLDEPWTSLDRPLADEMERVVSSLIASENSTVLFVTHAVREAATLADRVIELGGRPARLVSDASLDCPRRHRDPVQIDRLIGRLGQMLAPREGVLQ